MAMLNKCVCLFAQVLICGALAGLGFWAGTLYVASKNHVLPHESYKSLGTLTCFNWKAELFNAEGFVVTDVNPK